MPEYWGDFCNSRRCICPSGVDYHPFVRSCSPSFGRFGARHRTFSAANRPGIDFGQHDFPPRDQVAVIPPILADLRLVFSDSKCIFAVASYRYLAHFVHPRWPRHYRRLHLIHLGFHPVGTGPSGY